MNERFSKGDTVEDDTSGPGWGTRQEFYLNLVNFSVLISSLLWFVAVPVDVEVSL